MRSPRVGYGLHGGHILKQLCVRTCAFRFVPVLMNQRRKHDPTVFQHSFFFFVLLQTH